jgi:hypothetical protein
VPRPAWSTVYTALLVALDATAMAAATLTAKISWLGINPESFHVRSMSIPYGALALLTVPTWVVLLALAGTYDLGPFGTGSRSWIHVVRAGAQLLALIAVSYYILHLEMLGRGVLVGLVPLAVALTLGVRTVARFGLDQLRRRGRARRTALVVGPRHAVDAFVDRLDAHPTAGVAVTGVAVLGRDDADRRGEATSHASPDGNGRPGNGSHRTNGDGHPAPGADITDPRPALARALAGTGAESVIVTGGLAQGQVRDIAWMLEGTGIALLVTPAPADMPGVRSTMRPVAGLPLLYLDR